MRTRIARSLAQLGVVMVLAGGLCGCETLASIDPTGLLSDDSAPAADSASASPDLAGIPAAPTVPDDQRNVADSLAAQGAQAQYSADALRAGTEAAAPGPGPAAPVSPQVAAAMAAPPTAANDAPPSANDVPPSANDAPPTASPSAPIPVAGNAVAAAALPPVASPPSAAPPSAAPPATVAEAPNTDAAVPAAAPAPVRVASAAPPPGEAPPSAAMPSAAMPAAAAPPPSAALPPGAEPAVPAVPPVGSVRGAMMPAPVMSDAALGFRPSTAPPLDPSVSNFVSAPIMARYRQTASASGVPAGPGGTVVASASSAIGAIAARNGGVAPAAVVYFPGDGIALNAAARAQIRAAVAVFKAAGGSGTIRVVGHASSRTADMPVEKHLEVIFEKSQKRADAVAQELIHQGVPAGRVRIDAVGDSQPIYYESMPKGEDGNRRAEIFVQ